MERQARGEFDMNVMEVSTLVLRCGACETPCPLKFCDL